MTEQHTKTQNFRKDGELRGQNQQTHKNQKCRHRASTACSSCRDRRIRCVVPPEEKECTQCKRSGAKCIIKNDDERRRPISRAYMCSLTDRVALLEKLLEEQGVEVPPAHHPPKSRHAQQGFSTDLKSANLQHNQNQSSPGSQSSPREYAEVESVEHDNYSSHNDFDSAVSPSILPPPKRDGMVSRLLSTRGHLSFDQLSGRLRYFGPTTNCHVHSELRKPVQAEQHITEQAWRAEKVIRSLPIKTHDYLMEKFWQCYNSVIHVLHQKAFEQDREAGRAQFYSGFLHVCVLAIGFRHADKQRSDIKKITLSQTESTLHREVKLMLDQELERPGGIPTVVSMLLLGDLECGVGRDNLGWLYSGLAVRLAFDLGLHLDSRTSGLSQREVEIRQMTLWACVIYDKYWALFLGRPTGMKSADLEMYNLSKQFERLGTCRPIGPEKSLETQIYEALIELMELAGKIIENVDPFNQKPDSVVDGNQYLRVASLDREFSAWYTRLPEQLRWTPANIATAPFSFFLLHQQYHSSLILLYRPIAMYDGQSSNEAGRSSLNGQYSARTICTKHAIRVARIFWQHRQRFDTKQIFITGLQHAGTAATALVAALAYIQDPNDRNNNMQYLECLSAALDDMAVTYQPAERMAVVLRAVMVELRGGPVTNESKLYKPKSTLVPARRGSGDDVEYLPMYKKRQKALPLGNTGSSKHRTMSTASNVNIDLAIKPPAAPNCWGKDYEHSDRFIMVTPHSEIASWPPVFENTSQFSFATPPTATLPSSGPGNAWTGTELDTTENINDLAATQFPEMNVPGERSDMKHFDLLSMGVWGGVWGGEWNAGNGFSVVSDLDGFPPQQRDHGTGFGSLSS